MEELVRGDLVKVFGAALAVSGVAGRILAALVAKFGHPFSDFAGVGRRDLKFYVRLVLRVEGAEAFVTDLALEEHEVAKDALGGEHVLEQVRPEVRMDFGSAYRDVALCVDDGSRRRALATAQRGQIRCDQYRLHGAGHHS